MRPGRSRLLCLLAAQPPPGGWAGWKRGGFLIRGTLGRESEHMFYNEPQRRSEAAAFEGADGRAFPLEERGAAAGGCGGETPPQPNGAGWWTRPTEPPNAPAPAEPRKQAAEPRREGERVLYCRAARRRACRKRRRPACGRRRETWRSAPPGGRSTGARFAPAPSSAVSAAGVRAAVSVTLRVETRGGSPPPPRGPPRPRRACAPNAVYLSGGVGVRSRAPLTRSLRVSRRAPCLAAGLCGNPPPMAARSACRARCAPRSVRACRVALGGSGARGGCALRWSPRSVGRRSEPLRGWIWYSPRSRSRLTPNLLPPALAIAMQKRYNA